MKAITGWIKELGNWLPKLLDWFYRETVQIWITALVVVVIVYGSLFLIGKGDDYCWIRVAGFLLQLLGIGVVAKGLSNTRVKIFERDTAYKTMLASLDRRPRFGVPTVITGYVNAINNSDRAHGVGDFTRAIPDSLEERVKVLEQRLDLADSQLDKRRQEIEEETRKRTAEIELEAKARVAGDATVQEKLEKAVIGGLVLELQGIIWLAVGVGISAFPKGVAELPIFP
jgi:hypothetical protein